MSFGVEMTLREICEVYRGDPSQPILPKKVVIFEDRIEIEWSETPAYALRSVTIPKTIDE